MIFCNNIYVLIYFTVGDNMQKIKRTETRRSSGWGVFFKAMLITFLCFLLIALGYFAASYFSQIIK